MIELDREYETILKRKREIEELKSFEQDKIRLEEELSSIVRLVCHGIYTGIHKEKNVFIEKRCLKWKKVSKNTKK